jgi:hypothetical protein
MSSPSRWIDEGFPIGFAKLLEQLGDGGFGPFDSLARRDLSRQAFQVAFEVMTGALTPEDGQTWSGQKITSSELAYLKMPTGFTITIAAPDLDPYTLKFDKP